MKKYSFPFPILISREGRWYVSACPALGIATQGKTEKEVRDNMRELIAQYVDDPDTLKPNPQLLYSTSLTYVAVPIADTLIHGLLRSLRGLAKTGVSS